MYGIFLRDDAVDMIKEDIIIDQTTFSSTSLYCDQVEYKIVVTLGIDKHMYEYIGDYTVDLTKEDITIDQSIFSSTSLPFHRLLQICRIVELHTPC